MKMEIDKINILIKEMKINYASKCFTNSMIIAG